MGKGGKENAFIVVEIWRENMSLVGASFLFEIQSGDTRFERENDEVNNNNETMAEK